MSQIHWLVETISSQRDKNGNSYHAALVTNASTGKSAFALIDGPSNARNAIFNVLCKGKFNYHAIDKTLPIREFNKLTKGLPYAYGSLPEIAAFFKRATE